MKTRALLAIGGMYAGGSERRTLGLLQALDRERYQPELYLVSRAGELFPQIPADVPVHIFEDRVPGRRFRWPGGGFRARIADLAAVLREREIDLLCDRTYHMTLIAAGAVRLRPTPRISIIVSNPQSDFEANPERFRWLKRRLLRRAYREADVTAAVSAGVAQAAAAYHRLDPGQVELFHNFYDVEAILAASNQPLPAELRKQQGRLRIVATGRLHFAKAYDVLIEAVRRLVQERGMDALELIIQGNGPLQAELETRIAAAHLNGHVRLAGYQENPLPALLSADLYCLSSRYEGMPNALVEALVCGVPVVSTDCPHGPAEILEQGRWGTLTPPDDPAALAEALAEALNHPEFARQRATQAQRVIQERFSLTGGLRRFDELAELARVRFQRKQGGRLA